MPKPPTAPLYRLHLKTSGASRRELLDFCRRENLIGCGWGVGKGPLTWEQYEAKAEDDNWYGGVDGSVWALRDMPDGALVWTRDPRGVYYLARVEGPWEYLAGAEPDRLDLHNVRPARIVECGVEAVVPGKVANCFIPPRTLQSISDKAAARYSASLFAQLTGEASATGAWQPTLQEVVTTLLSSREVEDLVAMYLQRRRGYLVSPQARRKDTPAYEYALRHPDGHVAVAQVKVGHSSVPQDQASLPVDAADRVFVFQTQGNYSGEAAPNVERIDRDDLFAWMRDEPQCLPLPVEHWVRQAADGPSG